MNSLITTIKTLISSNNPRDLAAAIKKAELGYNAVKSNAELNGFKRGQLLAQYRSLRNKALRKLVALADSLKITLVVPWLNWSGKFTAFSSYKKQEYLADILAGKVKQFSVTF